MEYTRVLSMGDKKIICNKYELCLIICKGSRPKYKTTFLADISAEAFNPPPQVLTDIWAKMYFFYMYTYIIFFPTTKEKYIFLANKGDPP